MPRTLVFLIAFLPIAAAAGGAEADALLERAKSLDDAGKPAEAVSVLRQALALSPDGYWLHYQLAQSYLQLGRLADAKKEFAAARKIDPKASDAYIREGYGDMALGDATGAERVLRDFIAVDTANYEGYHHLGALFLWEGRPAECEHYLREALRREEADPKLDPGPMTHTVMHLSRCMRQQRRMGDAERLLHDWARRASIPFEQRRFLLVELAETLAAESRGAEAEPWFKKALAGADDPWVGFQINIRLARFYFDRDRKPEALKAAGRALELSRTVGDDKLLPGTGNAADSFVAIGRILETLGDRAGAERSYRRVIDMRRALPGAAEVKQAEAGLARLRLKPRD